MDRKPRVRGSERVLRRVGRQGQRARQAPAGTAGATGAAGANGSNGNTVLSGTSGPSSGQGVDGDFFLRTDTHCLWGPKASGEWAGMCTSLADRSTQQPLMLAKRGRITRTGSATVPLERPISGLAARTMGTGFPFVISAAQGVGFPVSSGSAVSGGVATLPAGSYWLCFDSDSTTLAISNIYTSAYVQGVFDGSAGNGVRPVSIIGSIAGSTGSGSSIAPVVNISAATWPSMGSGAPPMIAFHNYF